MSSEAKPAEELDTLDAESKRPAEAPADLAHSRTHHVADSGVVSSPGGAFSSALPADKLVAGRYEILALLGSGGMGTVYRARDRELDEVVALKVLRRDLLDGPGTLERFRREVKLSRRVTDRHVARAFDIGEHGEERFLTMEFVDGEPLSQLLAREGRLPLARVVQITSDVCAGLQAAHAAGVIHRDLKPDNVLIGRDGRVVITDFGIARALDAGGSARTVGVAVGTPAYMAPEQLEGSSEVDERADIYALGVILFELFTGDLPWKGASPYAVAAMRLSQPPPDPRALRPSLPAEAARLVLGCMARSPGDRFATVGKLRAALAAISLDAAPGERTPAPLAPPTMLVDTGPTSKTLAVLPFRSAASADDEYLADGLTEDLIDLLSMTAGLRVRPRGAVMPLRGNTRDVRELGRELGVQVVVEGSLRKAGDSVRISTRLISVQDGFQLWARRFDVRAADVLSVSDQIAQAITSALTVDAQPPARTAPTDPAALDAYFRARHEYHKFDRLSVLRAIELFDRARSLAPDDPMILTGYALARARLWFFGAEGSGERAKEAAERAVQLAPARGEPYVALATVKWNLGEVEGAVRLLRQALTLAPSLVDAHDMMGRILSETGPLDRGLDHLETAFRLDPSFHESNINAARVHALLGRWETAFGILADERRVGSQTAWVQSARIIGWHKDSLALARALLDDPGLDRSHTNPAFHILRFVADPGRDADPTTFLAQGLGSVHAPWRSRAILLQAHTEFALGLRRPEEALAKLEGAVSVGLVDVAWLDLCPPLEPLRADPRFLAARAEVSARAERARSAL